MELNYALIYYFIPPKQNRQFHHNGYRCLFICVTHYTNYIACDFIILISPLPQITRDIHPSSHDDTLPFYENNER
nr:MAG TPA: hypothetical protein [Caudoviricetes sp.]